MTIRFHYLHYDFLQMNMMYHMMYHLMCLNYAKYFLSQNNLQIHSVNVTYSKIVNDLSLRNILDLYYDSQNCLYHNFDSVMFHVTA